MSKKLYAIDVNGQQYTVSADWVQASCPVEFGGCGTKYQVADFRHSSREAMECFILSDESGSAESLDEIGVDLDDMVAYDLIDGEYVRLSEDADSDHESAEDMYEAFGWHLTTEDAGDVCLQAVSYEDADDIYGLAEQLVDENDGLTQEEAELIAAKAVEVREYCDSVEMLLGTAESYYYASDTRRCINALDEAAALESDGGDSPAANTLRAKLIEALASE